MILLFGGTTEGRKAIKELEEGGKTYYYSTKTGEQEVTLHHGVRIDGAMDGEAMAAFCRERGVRLIIDAAHPFAQVLHQTVAEVAKLLQLPAIRFERIFPPHHDDIIWCKDFDDALSRIDCHTLLATTGVQSISRLKPLEQRGIRVVYRILNRESSLRLAHQQGATDSQLVFYDLQESSERPEQLATTDADAILLKESGLTGGFAEKVAWARQRGMTIYAIERPETPAIFQTVNGEHGLRRMVEQLLPDFYDLHSGLTTGTCATAAAVAALITHHSPHTNEVPVILPNGETIMVHVGYAPDGSYAYCIKESGDDPDVTNGIEVRASVTIEPSPSDDGHCIKIRSGEGVGRFTLPGFDYPPGEPAINKGPREMIRQNLLAQLPLLRSATSGDTSLVKNAHPSLLTVTISVPGGEALAQRTFNPRLGIEGGISIIGVSGIVKPFSEETFIDSIRKCMQVAKASGTDRVVVNSGAKSERFVKALYPTLPRQAFVEYGNYIGETLRMAHELHFKAVTLGVMLGKAVKLAEGQLDTHSRKGTMNKNFLEQLLQEVGLSGYTPLLQQITLARELWERLPTDALPRFAQTVIDHCRAHCQPLFPDGELTILLIDDNGQIYP